MLLPHLVVVRSEGRDYPHVLFATDAVAAAYDAEDVTDGWAGSRVTHITVMDDKQYRAFVERVADAVAAPPARAGKRRRAA